MSSASTMSAKPISFLRHSVKGVLKEALDLGKTENVYEAADPVVRYGP